VRLSTTPYSDFICDLICDLACDLITHDPTHDDDDLGRRAARSVEHDPDGDVGALLKDQHERLYNGEWEWDGM
jgi:hypothetical protein